MHKHLALTIPPPSNMKENTAFTLPVIHTDRLIDVGVWDGKIRATFICSPLSKERSTQSNSTFILSPAGQEVDADRYREQGSFWYSGIAWSVFRKIE